MFSIIIEAIATTLAETLSTKALEKGQAKHPRLYGWIALIVLLIITGGCMFLGGYLLGLGVWPIAVLMFAIAAFIFYITVASVYKNMQKKKQ